MKGISVKLQHLSLSHQAIDSIPTHTKFPDNTIDTTRLPAIPSGPPSDSSILSTNDDALTPSWFHNLNRPANPAGGSPGPSDISRRLPKRVRRIISFLSANLNHRRNPYTAGQEAISFGFPRTCDPLEDPNRCPSYSTRHRWTPEPLEGCSASPRFLRRRRS